MNKIGRFDGRGRNLVLAGLVSLFFAGGVEALTVERIWRTDNDCRLMLSYESAAVDRAVFVGYGDSDKGATLDAWGDSVVSVSGVAKAGSTSTTVVLAPEADEAKFVRVFLLTDDTYSCAYLRTTGKQFIKTDVYPVKRDTKVEADFTMQDISTAQQRIFGDTGNHYLHCYINGSLGWSWSYSDAGNWTAITSPQTLATKTRTQVTIDGPGDKWTYVIADVGTKTGKISSSSAASKCVNTATNPMLLFAEAKDKNKYANLKMYSMTFTQGDKVRSYKPALKDGVACVYEETTDTYHYDELGTAPMFVGKPAAATVAEAAPAAVAVPHYVGGVHGTSATTAGISLKFVPFEKNREIWYCWGDEDKGEDFMAWPNNERIGTAAAFAGGGGYTLPPSSVGAKAGRVFLVSAGGTYECSYIRADRIQAIDTGVPVNTNTALWADIKFNSAIPVQQRIWGNNVSDGFRFYNYINGSGNWAWSAVDTDGTKDGNNCNSGVAVECKRTQVTVDCAKQVFKLEQDGKVLKSMKFSEHSTWAGMPYSNMSSMAPVGLLGTLAKNRTFSNGSIAELYGAKIWTGGVDGTPMRDFRPWVSNGVAVMKDLVSNKYFANAHTNNTTQFVPGGRKTAPTTVFFSSDVSADLSDLTCDDVFADAAFWLRGMAEDKNGNGIVDGDEFKDALGRTDISATMYGTDGKRMVYSNELVRLPGRGVERMMRTIYLPQTITITNTANNTGYCEPTTAYFPNLLTGFDNHWTMVVRVRPDNDTPPNGWQWIIQMAHSGSDKIHKGLEFGFNGTGTGTNGTRRLGIYAGGKDLTGSGWTMLSGNGAFTNSYLGGWVDIAIVADGQKLTALMIQEGDKLPANNRLSAVQFGYRYLDSPVSLSFNGTALRLGAEGSDNKKHLYPMVSNDNYIKAFRGSFQQFAMWRRALSTAELFQALGWPRTDLMRVGVADGTADEFEGNVPTAGFDADAETWPLANGLAAGESVTVKFPLVKDYDTQIARILRWKALPDSPVATLRAIVNGAGLPPEVVKPGAYAQWFVPFHCLKAGTNTVTITRVDGGAGRLVPDAIALGGGWQIGIRDNSYSEFAYESVGLKDYYVADGNLRDIRRVLFCKISNADRSYDRFHFNLPEELAGQYRWKLRFAINGDGHSSGGAWPASGVLPLVIKLNEKTLLDQNVKKGQEFAFDLEAEDLLKGENVLHFWNNENTTKTTYIPLDLLSLSPKNPYGMAIMVK